jgi:hypothetical protein
VKVLLDGAVVTTTDAAGRFFVAEAGATYDLALSASADRAFVYQGMTTRTPVVRLDGTYLSPDESEASVHVDLTGVDATTWVGASPSIAAGEPASAIEPLGPSDWRVRWAGHDPIHVGVYVAAHEGVPSQRVGQSVGTFLAPAVPLSPGGTKSFALQAASLVAAGESAVAAEVHLAPSYGVSQAVLWEGSASDAQSGAAFDVETRDSVLPFLVPEGARVGLTIEATSGAAKTDVYVGIPAGGGRTVVDVPAAPIALAPPDDSIDVGAGTELRWTPAPNATNFAIIYDGYGTSAPTIRIVAADGVARIPDLAPIGVVLPAHARVAWAPSTTTPAGSVDDFAASGAAASPATPQVTTQGAGRGFLTP